MDNSWWIILNAIGGHSWCRENGSIDVLSWVQSGLGVNLINAFWVISDIFWGSDFYFYHLLKTFFHCDDYRLSCWCWLSSCELTLVSLVLHSLRQIIIGLRFSKTTWLQTYITFSKLALSIKTCGVLVSKCWFLLLISPGAQNSWWKMWWHLLRALARSPALFGLSGSPHIPLYREE